MDSHGQLSCLQNTLLHSSLPRPHTIFLLARGKSALDTYLDDSVIDCIALLPFENGGWNEAAKRVVSELFQGNMLEAEKDKQAFKYIEETVRELC